MIKNHFPSTSLIFSIQFILEIIFYCQTSGKILFNFRKLLSSHLYVRYHAELDNMSLVSFDLESAVIAVLCHSLAL